MFATIVCALAVLTQPTGREWEDETLVSQGKVAAHSDFAAFPDVESAKGIRREMSPWCISLDSEKDWRFRWCRRPEERPIGFQEPGYDVSTWDVVKVPCSWQAMGIRASGKPYDRPFYCNAGCCFTRKFPANTNTWPRVRGHEVEPGATWDSHDNPVGSYRRDFSVPASWVGETVTLRFDGVDSFFYLWVNGTYVGFSKSSRDPAEFDISTLVKEGRNTVAVEVYRLCDGSYLETQDMLNLSGIFRSVSLLRAPTTRIRDVTIATRPVRARQYAGAWALDLGVAVEGNADRQLGVEVFDAAGARVSYAGSPSFEASLVFEKPLLWSAEEPNLYTLVLTLLDGTHVMEAVSFQLGFREIEITEPRRQIDRTFLVNGQPIKMRGANRHETSPKYGHYTPDELIELDVKQLKRANCNHVRNSHYPQPTYFYYLCNKYGIYVMDEANIESHCFFYGKESLSHVKSWEAAHVDRTRNMVARNKCHPSIVIWSLGNEAGPGDNFKACYAEAKRIDATRPVQYERNNWIGDMGARQYPTVDWLWACAKGEKLDITLTQEHERKGRELRYPYHINEYAHNMGNAMGNLKDYQDAIESTTRICGAAIWDWVDQGIYWEVKSKSEKVKSDWGEESGEDSKRTTARFAGVSGERQQAYDSKKGEGQRPRTPRVKVLAYGGDFGDLPTEGQFMMNGCVMSDRTVEPGYWEIKHVFQPLTATASKDGVGVDIFNRHYFRSADAYDCYWTIFEEGRAVANGIWNIRDLKAREHRIYRYPTLLSQLRDEGRFTSIRVEFYQREEEGYYPAGWRIACDQIDFPTKPPKVQLAGNGAVDETDKKLVLSAGPVAITFSKRTGEIVSYKHGHLFKTEQLKGPVTLDVFRAPSQNETRETCLVDWYAKGLQAVKPCEATFSPIARDVDGTVRFTVEQLYRGTKREKLDDYFRPWLDHISLGAPDKDKVVAFRVVTSYVFGGDGRLAVSSEFEQASPAKVEPPRVGWRFVIDDDDAKVAWFGAGPYENYTDRLSASFVGRWRSTSQKFFVPYDRPQTCGNREFTRELEIGHFGFVAQERPFAFNVSPYDEEELVETMHPAELPKPEKTCFGVYARVRGLGGNSCGPLPLDRDVIAPNERCTLSFVLEPR